ncbi:MAG: hypothetical protein JNL12_04790 [Planctomycetes bacterium]|nr:hypothetical protein [Planctomycetota bacterium]
MGLLSWLFGKRRRDLPVSVWLDEANRVAGLVRTVQADLAAGRTVVLVAHFPQSLIEAGQALAAAGMPLTTLTKWSSPDREPRVLAILAKSLPHHDPGAPPALEQSAARFAVRAAELHVLGDENDRVLQFLDTLPKDTEVSAFVSFDSPTMATFARPWVRAMMQKLGMRPDAPIDSPMVTRGFRKALAKLEQRVVGNQPADSLAEWMQRNLRRE